MTIKELKEFMYEYCNKQFLFSEISKEKSDQLLLVAIKSVTMEDRKISRILSTAVRQTEKISGEGSEKKIPIVLYTMKKLIFFFTMKKP